MRRGNSKRRKSCVKADASVDSGIQRQPQVKRSMQHRNCSLKRSYNNNELYSVLRTIKSYFIFRPLTTVQCNELDDFLAGEAI